VRRATQTLEADLSVSVEWEDREIRVSLAPGDRLLDALDERPQTGMVFGCRDARCGTCRVHVIEGAAAILPAAPEEAETLLAINAHSDERLACQISACLEHGRLRLRCSPIGSTKG